MKLGRIEVEIKGITPLLSDRFPDKAKDAILAKEFGLSKTQKTKLRNKEKELEEAVHYTNKKQICFPAEAFKKGMMEVTSFVGDRKFTKKLVSGSVFIITDYNDQDNAPCILINTKKKYKELKHWVFHNVKFTPMFEDWGAKITFEFDPETITADDIVNCLNVAGKMQGVGAWRPRCRDGGSGNYGKYTVIDVKAIDPKKY